jgi:hypothetical protein
MGLRGLVQPDRVENWVQRLAETFRSFEVKIPVVASRLWDPAALASSGGNREMCWSVDFQMTQ